MKTNPEKFAKYVLWSLSGIQAHLWTIQYQMIAEAAMRTANPKDATAKYTEAWKKQRESFRHKMYLHMAKEVGLPPEDQTPPEWTEPPFEPPNRRV